MAFVDNDTLSFVVLVSDKLEITKRFEGSQALRRWRRLATPTPLGFIGREERTEGVKTRAVPKSPPSVARNELPKPPTSLDITSFLEEIDSVQDSPLNLPGKSFVDSSCIYTYSNSNVLHPDATNTSTTSSLARTKMAVSAGMKRSPVQTTPSVINRSSYLATTTCSVNRGLAQMLNERGIHAMLPSVLRERSEGDEEMTGRRRLSTLGGGTRKCAMRAKRTDTILSQLSEN